jgi:peptidoglycan-N-acetylmuramic acid deacetylase
MISPRTYLSPTLRLLALALALAPLAHSPVKAEPSGIRPIIQLAKSSPSAQAGEPREEIRRAIPVARPASEAWRQSFASYAAHTLRKGENITTLAAEGGSTPEAIATYNRLSGPPQLGRPLIIPSYPGTNCELQTEPLILERAPARKARIALTLDAGSTAQPLPRVLEALRKRHITITFFVTGYFIRENPELIRQIAADGHEFGNHSLSHPDLRNVDDKRLLREIMETEHLLNATAGATTRPFFRPPFGAYNNHVLATAGSLGFLPIYWTLDSLDSVGAAKNGNFLYQRVTSQLTEDQLHGAIILMHVDSMGTADAMPSILDRFASMGFEVCKLSRVLNDA